MTANQNRPRRLLALAAFLALLGACSMHPSKPAKSAEGVVATINGHAIHRREFDLFLQLSGTPARIAAPTLQRIVLERMIDIDLLAHQAHKEHLEDKRFVRLELRLQRRVLLANAFVRHYLKTHPISPAAIAERYHELMSHVGHHLYEVRTIRVGQESLAQRLAHDLAHGASFAKLAQRYSQSPSGKHGGYVGWIGLSEVPPPVASALRGLKVGGHTSQPIRTPTGWHLYLLEAKRPISHPSLKAMTPRILAELREEMIEKVINGLRSKAKVKIAKDAFVVPGASVPAVPPLHPTVPPKAVQAPAKPGSTTKK